MAKNITITSVRNDGEGASLFSSREISLHGDTQRMLSDQQSAVNFRFRESDASYASTWHVAGDPTLLIILAGAIRIELRNGDTRDFFAGDKFIAEDYLSSGHTFDPSFHGHRAEVIGNDALSVIHLKLEKRIV
jgi:hypothetical protein